LQEYAARLRAEVGPRPDGRWSTDAAHEADDPEDHVEEIDLEVRRTRPEAVLPAYAHDGDAGLDLATVEALEVRPGQRVAAPTGLAMAIPPGWVGLVHPRSGLARRYGLTVANAPGTIDSGYRGEVQVLLVNLGEETVEVGAGERVAQLLLQRVGRARVREVAALDATERADGGFGSTGRGGA
jgi:dUTP pyrophosphatase